MTQPFKRTCTLGAALLLGATLLLNVASAPVAHALVGAHSYTNTTTGDVFLGGDYIEVGISKFGSFGTSTGQTKPAGFYGAGSRTNIGMSSNAAGFGESPDTRIDYFLPGNPEERWIVGYKQSGTPTTGSNAFLNNSTDISDYTVVDQSAGALLKASGSGTLNSTLEVGQVISFQADEKYFKNIVTLKNVSGSPIDSVRFMRSFDPDNTRDKSGQSATRNEVLYTHADGDGKAVVVADTSNNPNDPVFLTNGSRSPILFYSKDVRAKVSTFGFSNDDPYVSSAYDTPTAKNAPEDGDQAITITADIGTLAPGASDSFIYYTSLDNRDIDDIIQSIDVGDGDNIPDAVENAAPNSGDGNGDGTQDSQQPHVTSLPNPIVGGNAYQTLQTTGCPTITNVSVESASSLGADGGYSYPVGMTDFTLDCGAPGDTANIVIYYEKQYDTSKWTARKFINGAFQNLSGAVFGTAVVGANTVTTLSYSITDGGSLDADGAANGVIVDPAGPAVLAAATTAGTSPASAPNTGLRAESASLPVIAMIAAGILLVIARLLPASQIQNIGFNRKRGQ